MAIKRITGEVETNTVIWQNMRRQVIRPIIQQFLYKTLHGTHLIRKYWRNINGYEERETCATCNETELMSHILTECREQYTQTVWRLAKNLWLHRNMAWPEITLGTILGCGCIHLQPERTKEEQPATTEQGGLLRPNPTPPYLPIRIGIPDMGPEV
jgi:ribonuclease HI